MIVEISRRMERIWGRVVFSFSVLFRARRSEPKGLGVKGWKEQRGTHSCAPAPEWSLIGNDLGLSSRIPPILTGSSAPRFNPSPSGCSLDHKIIVERFREGDGSPDAIQREDAGTWHGGGYLGKMRGFCTDTHIRRARCLGGARGRNPYPPCATVSATPGVKQGQNWCIGCRRMSVSVYVCRKPRSPGNVEFPGLVGLSFGSGDRI